MKATIAIVYNKLPAMPARLRRMAADATEKAARDCERLAKTLAPVATGHLRNSITAIQVSPLHWIVEVGAEYGIFVEFGTVHMSAQPYLLPAFERVRPSYHAALSQLERMAA